MLTDISSLLLTIFNMSITACFFALAVIVFRLVFKKAPKYISCLLWGLVALRLVFPFSIESIFSLVPSSETFPKTIITDNSFKISSGINVIDNPINEYLGDRYFEGITVPANNGLNTMKILSVIWLVGIFAMLLYAVISVIRVKKSVRMSVPLLNEKRIYMADKIETAFILGVFKPKIFVPSNIDENDLKLVIAHEKTHLKRFDHYFKPLGFLLLSVYWFNPVLWICYILFCKDIEGACDEKVLKSFSEDVKKDYSKALIRLSTAQKLVVACPLAFGETGVKGRVKNILNYKKPAFWLVAVAVVATIIASACFLTNPMRSRSFEMESTSIADINPARIDKEIKRIQKLDDDTVLYVRPETSEMYIKRDYSILFPIYIEFYYEKNNKNYSSKLQIMHNSENIYYVTKGEKSDISDFRLIEMQDYLEALKYLPNEEIGKISPDYACCHLFLKNYSLVKNGENVISYSSSDNADESRLSLQLQCMPMKRIPENNSYSSQGITIDLYYSCEYHWYTESNPNYYSYTPKYIEPAKDIDEAIHLALISDEEAHDECKTEGHIIFGKEEKDLGSTIFVYFFYHTSGFEFSNGNLVSSSGSSGLAAAVVTKAFDDYSVYEIRYPLDGNLNYNSKKEIIPLKFQLRALTGPTEKDVEKMENQIQSQAKKYLHSIKRDAKIYPVSEVSHRYISDYFDISDDLQNELEKAIGKESEFDCEAGSFERIEDSTRYVYETEFDVQGERIILTKYEYETKSVVEYHEIDVKTATYIENATHPQYFIANQYALDESKK